MLDFLGVYLLAGQPNMDLTKDREFTLLWGVNSPVDAKDILPRFLLVFADKKQANFYADSNQPKYHLEQWNHVIQCRWNKLPTFLGTFAKFHVWLYSPVIQHNNGNPLAFFQKEMQICNSWLAGRVQLSMQTGAAFNANDIHKFLSPHDFEKKQSLYPYHPCIYGIFTHIWLIFMA